MVSARLHHVITVIMRPVLTCELQTSTESEYSTVANIACVLRENSGSNDASKNLRHTPYMYMHDKGKGNAYYAAYSEIVYLPIQNS